jgi:CDP-diacylglycerol---serine O-phosphatidyltransferase
MSNEHTIKHTQLYKKIPTLLTLGNSLCGFTAIVLALQAYEKILVRMPNNHFEINPNGQGTIMPDAFAFCAWLIIGAMVFDALDGWAARKLNATSLHGIEMDSLADMVTFGVAPAVMVYVYSHVNVFLGFRVIEENGFLRHDKIVWAAAAIYISCAALRLAFYNATAMEQKFNPDPNKSENFTGIPSPGAASAVCSIVIMGTSGVQFPEWIMTTFLPLYTALLGFLMISPIPYPHMAKWLVSPVKRLRKLIILILITSIAFYEYIRFGEGPKITAAVLINIYVFSGPILILSRKITGRRLHEDEDL